MAINKVNYGGDTLIDLTQDTVTPSALQRGVTAHNAAGVQITGTNDGSGGSLPPMESVTWSALKALRDGGQLTPGMQYRITDYNTIVTGYYDLSALAEGVQGYLHYGDSAGHAFDVIVTADSEDTLNENARAALHEGDTYFANSDLAAWELKYCLDNDATRFSFANSNGKGVIFGMKDEFGNECGYDFKNWRFVRYALALSSAEGASDECGFVYDASKGQVKRYGSPYHVIMALMAYMDGGSYVNPIKRNYELSCGASILGSVQAASIDATYLSTYAADLYYTFDYYDISEGEHSDLSLNAFSGAQCKNNTIAQSGDMIGLFLLMQAQESNPLADMVGVGCNVFQATSALMQMMPIIMCSDNRLGENAMLNTFGAELACMDVELGSYCRDVELGSSCSDVELGSYCSDVELGSSCRDVRLGSRCYQVTLGQQNQNNTIDGYVRNVEMETGCQYVTLEWSNTDQYGNFQNGPQSIKIANLYNVTIPTSEKPTGGRAEIVRYNTSNGHATIINHTGPDTKTVKSTTNGGTTWTAA